MKEDNIIDRFNRWVQESITVKLFTIGFLLLVLLIPLSLIEDLINERQQRSEEVQLDITSKWSGAQTICGPIIVLPYKKLETLTRKDGTTEMIEVDDRIFLAPEELAIAGSVAPQVLHRGIFEAVVYESELKLTARYVAPDFTSLEVDPGKVNWAGAQLVAGISDLRGVSENPGIKLGNETLVVDPSSEVGFYYGAKSETGLSAPLKLKGADDLNQPVSVSLHLKGSRAMNFTPIGKTTKAELQGPWQNPSFDGEFLPQSRSIGENGFNASWTVLHFNRPFVQQWKQSGKFIGGSDFGVNLLIPVEQYQKSMRTYKYGVLVILLTFISLFLVEISMRVRIHPFQYTLIGAALIIYYTLLLSFAEQVGYNMAYFIASAATILLVSLYSRTFLPSVKSVALFASILTASYVFILIIIIQQDFSLLIGSVGLFLIIGTIMYLTRRINWYRDSIEQATT
ncbi:MAG: cell envelope integrity protein CreD [Cyclobacteriaceae bacterium]